MVFFCMIQPFGFVSLAEINAGEINSSEYEYASFSLACLIMAIIVISIVNSLSLILRHYQISDHPIIQLRFNALFTAYKCQEGKLLPQLFIPIALALKILSLYIL